MIGNNIIVVNCSDFIDICVRVNLCILYFLIMETDNASEFIIYLFYFVVFIREVEVGIEKLECILKRTCC